MTDLPSERGVGLRTPSRCCRTGTGTRICTEPYSAEQTRRHTYAMRPLNEAPQIYSRTAQALVPMVDHIAVGQMHTATVTQAKHEHISQSSLEGSTERDSQGKHARSRPAASA